MNRGAEAISSPALGLRDRVRAGFAFALTPSRQGRQDCMTSRPAPIDARDIVAGRLSSASMGVPIRSRKVRV